MNFTKFIVANLAVNLMSFACVYIAGYLVMNDKGNWGWFLLAGAVFSSYVTYNKKK